MAASRSTEPADRSNEPTRVPGYERLAAAGAIACIASLPLPWYRAPFSEDLVKTGLGSFGLAQAALLLTVASTLFLLREVRSGRRPALPLRVGTLLVVAGVWSALIVAYLMIDRPDFTLRPFEGHYTLAYGIFVALGGAVVMVLAGLRMRRLEPRPSSRRE